MNTFPTLDEIRRITADGAYDIAPVCCEILSDFTTPIEVVRILKNVSAHCFLLESAQANEQWGRYTFLGYEPTLSVSCLDGTLCVDGREEHTEDPSSYLRSLLKTRRSPRFAGLPPFTGGLVGYFAFDYLGYSEPAARSQAANADSFRDMDVMLFDRVIAFDHVRQKITLITNIRLDDMDANYAKAEEELQAMQTLLMTGTKKPDDTGRLLGGFTPLFDREQFCSMVEKAKHYIHEGDIFQVVLSNRLSAPFEGSLLDTYRQLRTINPSPYMFYFSGTDVEVAGASPETLVKLQDGVLHTFPLAGTRPRGRDAAQDEQLTRELLADEKELAEHNMLVDLGRNDLGRISRFGTVEVEKLRSVVYFSHVMHIGSTVRGEIREDKDALDAIEAVLPAGTLSGAPKIRACQLINELENSRRGIYGGAIGYIDFTGNMDTCIAIRLAYRKNSTVYVRSGAGIVADSVPQTEYEESINKAKAVMNAIMAASGGNRT